MAQQIKMQVMPDQVESFMTFTNIKTIRSRLAQKKLIEDFVLFSIDVNGLKTVNDTKGHAAGDELIKGAANCLALTVGNRGKAYRTGGDEFMAIVNHSDPEGLRKDIKRKADEWHGVYNEFLAVSVGYAAFKDNPEVSIDELEHRADQDMYAEKERYYMEKGIKRR
ncbi:MAG: GGDEF domain-containing protein [Lachnospiraceae bacterium]|nr:GGDEF domain-containing protein [Lachnospiraceae bacterium]